MGSHITAGGRDVRAILDAIRRVVRVLRVSSRAAEKAVGLSGAQLFVLHHLAAGPAVSLNELAGRTRTHQSSVSVVVHRLVERGFVSRGRSAADGRRVELSLTPAARAVLRRSPGAAQDELIAALEQFSPADRGRLARLLGKLAERLGDGGEDAPPMFFEDEPEAGKKKRTPRRQGAERKRQEIRSIK